MPNRRFWPLRGVGDVNRLENGPMSSPPSPPEQGGRNNGRSYSLGCERSTEVRRRTCGGTGQTADRYDETSVPPRRMGDVMYRELIEMHSRLRREFFGKMKQKLIQKNTVKPI